MIAPEVSEQTYGFIGVPDAFHALSHHANHSLLLYGSNMSNSNAHNPYPLPTALVGRACGAVKGGQHINFPERTPLANVLLTMLQRIGVRIDRLGDSTGAIAEI